MLDPFRGTGGLFLSAAGPFETRIARTQIIPWRAGPKCARAGVVSVYRNAARRLERSDYSERRMDGGGRGARSTSSSLPGRQTVFCRVHDKPGTPFRRKGSAEGFPFPVKGSAAPRSAPPAGAPTSTRSGAAASSGIYSCEVEAPFPARRGAPAALAALCSRASAALAYVRGASRALRGLVFALGCRGLARGGGGVPLPNCLTAGEWVGRFSFASRWREPRRRVACGRSTRARARRAGRARRRGPRGGPCSSGVRTCSRSLTRGPCSSSWHARRLGPLGFISGK